MSTSTLTPFDADAMIFPGESGKPYPARPVLQLTETEIIRKYAPVCSEDLLRSIKAAFGEDKVERVLQEMNANSNR